MVGIGSLLKRERLANHRVEVPGRKAVLDLLANEGPLYPREIADLLRKNYGTTRYLLFAMKKDGQLGNNEKGQYTLIR